MAIEGNIGVGKSTVIEHLKKRFEGREDVVFIDEPVDEWRSRGFLKRMYEDPAVKPAFQHMVLMSLAGDLLKALASEPKPKPKPKPKYIITERSPWGQLPHVWQGEPAERRFQDVRVHVGAAHGRAARRARRAQQLDGLGCRTELLTNAHAPTASCVRVWVWRS